MKFEYLLSQFYIRFLSCLLVIAVFIRCTEEKTILAPPQDNKPPAVEWVSVDGKQVRI